VSQATYVIGDVRDCLAALPDGSVDLILTSPPFLALRSYLPADHPDKHREIGGEPTPAAFVDTLLGLSAEWRRVLAPHGSIAVELGDSYAGSGGGGGDYRPGGLRDGQNRPDGSMKWDRSSGRKAPCGQPYTDTFKGGGPGGPGWPQAKSLAMIPELYRVALAYGINPLTGQPSPAGQWRCRNVVRWCRPNPPVGALGDKVRPATSDMVIACTARDRYFDLDSVRTNYGDTFKRQMDRGEHRGAMPSAGPEVAMAQMPKSMSSVHAGAPPLDHWWADPDTFDQDAWLVSTEPYGGSHFATWPRKLLTRPILSMCPSRVCQECGQPSRRITERSAEYAAARSAIGDFNQRDAGAGNSGSRSVLVKAAGRDVTCAENITTGWSDCGHNAWRPGVTLDPFAGSGTTLAVATGHGRDAIGFDFDARNADLALERVGPMFLTVQTLDEWKAAA